MNFFAHAWLAMRRRPDPAFVLGAMLPDLAPMAGLRVRAVDHPVARSGHRFHIETDAAFHDSPVFRELSSAGTRALRAAGLRRGPALGAGHAGVELLLDGWIAEHHGVPDLYRESLGRAREIAPGIRWRTGARSRPFAELCVRVASAPVPESYRRADFATERLVRLLGRHPRLALEPGERSALAAWMRETALRVSDTADALVAETEAALDA